MQIVLATTAATRGGVWRHIEDLGTGLQQRGHRVVVGLYPAAAELEAAADRAGLETEDFAKTIRRRGWLWHGHLHDTYDRAFLRAAVRRRTVGPTVLTEHLPHTNASDPLLHPGPRRPLARSAKTLMKRLQYQLVQRVIAVSPSSKAFLVERYGSRWVPVEAVMNGVPRTAALDPPGPGARYARVLCVGAVHYQKGFDVLVEASTRGPALPWRAVVLGDGSAREALQRRAAELGVIAFPGWSDDVVGSIAAADIVCIPSRWESAPYIALEAMAAGRPIVATDVDGLRDVVVHGVTGLIVNPDDASALSSALDRLATSEDLRLEMGRAGFARAREFTVDRMIEQTIRVYREVAPA